MRADGPGQPAQLLLDVVDLLTATGVPHALVGAFAVSFHREQLDLELLKRLTRRYGKAEARTLEQLLAAPE